MKPWQSYFRFGIAGLLLLTSLVAAAVRYAQGWQVTKLTFDDLQTVTLGNSTIPGSRVTTRIQNLNGSRVSIRGYFMAQSVFQAKGIRKVILMRDHQEPALEDCDYLIVNLQGDATVDFITRPITVIGRFTVLSPPLSQNKSKLYYQIEADAVGI